MGRVFTIADGLENIGALRTGGQGSVYKARRGEQISAVKILPTPIYSEDESDKNYIDFRNEVAKLQKVNEEPNPNVVKILSSGITESGSLPYIEMEFIEGPDLEDLLKAPLDPVFTIKECVKVAEQLSGALAHCHKLGVKHGDLKSNNVKFNIQTDNYVLLDFGLAVMSDEQRRTSMRNAGAIEFMAPEQHEGEMTVRSDVYSFGVVFYELLAGVVPFPLLANGESARNAIMISHMEKPVPDVLASREKNMPETWDESRRDFELQVPAWLLSTMERCLEKRPENRFENGVELQQVIIESKKLYTGLYEYDSSDSAVLRRDNERLKALLLKYQNTAAAPTAAMAGIAGTAAATAGVLDSFPEGAHLKRAPGNILTKLGTAGTSSLNSFKSFSGVVLTKLRTVNPDSIKRFSGTIFTKLGISNPKPVLIGSGLFLASLILFAGYSSSVSQKAELADSLAAVTETKRVADSLEAAVALAAINNPAPAAVSQPEKRRGKQNKASGKRKRKGSAKFREDLQKQFDQLRGGRGN